MSAGFAAASAAPAELSKAHPSHPLLQPGQQVTCDVLIAGVPTGIIITSFADRIYIAVTQMNKLGSFSLAATTHLVSFNTHYKMQAIASTTCARAR